MAFAVAPPNMAIVGRFRQMRIMDCRKAMTWRKFRADLSVLLISTTAAMAAYVGPVTAASPAEICAAQGHRPGTGAFARCVEQQRERDPLSGLKPITSDDGDGTSLESDLLPQEDPDATSPYGSSGDKPWFQRLENLAPQEETPNGN